MAFWEVNFMYMSRIRLCKFLFLIAVFIAGCAHAASVFKVTKNDNTVYIGGTFHLLTPSDYPLPKAFNVAYNASNEIYFETDIAATQSPEFAQQMMSVILSPEGKTLKDELTQATFQRVEEYINERGLDINQFLPMNATGLMLTITLMEYQSRGFIAVGVDEHFFKKAQADNKKMGWFESVEEQLAVLDSFDSGDPDGLVNYTLNEIDKVDELIKGLHASWRTGNMQKLTKLGLDSFSEYPDLHQVLLSNRNNHWMEKILPFFENESVEFVLVGALHLPGRDGLLTQLEAQGFTIEQLK